MWSAMEQVNRGQRFSSCAGQQIIHLLAADWNRVSRAEKHALPDAAAQPSAAPFAVASSLRGAPAGRRGRGSETYAAGAWEPVSVCVG